MFQNELKGITQNSNSFISNPNILKSKSLNLNISPKIPAPNLLTIKPKISPFKPIISHPRQNSVSIIQNSNKTPLINESIKNSFRKSLSKITQEKCETGLMQKDFINKKAGVLNSSKQFSTNLLFSGSGQSKKFDLLKESDLGSSPIIKNEPKIPTVSPIVPIINSGITEKNSVKSSISAALNIKDLTEKSKFISAQSEKYTKLNSLSKSTEFKGQKNYYAKYSMAMEKNGFFTNNWFIPVQKLNGHYVSSDGHKFELFKSHTEPLEISDDLKILKGITVFATLGGAKNEIEGSSLESNGVLRVHVTGSYTRLKVSKFVFSCVTPIEFIAL